MEKYVLVDGWKRIAKDEELNGGDFLAFEFDGSRCFNFCVYEGRTMCKRLRRCSEQTIEISEKSNNEEETGASEEVRVPDDDDDDSEDADYDSVDDTAVDDEVDDEDDYDVDNDADVEDLGVEAEANDVDDADVDVEDLGDEAEDDVGEDDDDVVKVDPSFSMTLNPKKKSQLVRNIM